MLPFTTDPDSKGIDTSLYMYDLTSAVVHKGKLDAGHYYVYCRRGDQVRLLIDRENGSMIFLSSMSLLTFDCLGSCSYTLSVRV